MHHKGYHVFVYIRSSMLFSVSQSLPRVCLHQIFYVIQCVSKVTTCLLTSDLLCSSVCLKGYHMFVYIRSSMFFSVSQRLPCVCLHQIFYVLQCVSKVNTKVWMLWLLALRLSKTWLRCSQSFYVLLCVCGWQLSGQHKMRFRCSNLNSVLLCFLVHCSQST